MGKSAEVLTLIPETQDTGVDEDDIAWLRDLVEKYGTEDNSTDTEQPEVTD